jgi:4-hydroxybenzoate polyprenyltransferase
MQFLGLFIYVMIGEAFWDIRDVHGDRTQGVRTIPVVFGVIPTKIYLIALILTDLFVFGKSVTDSTIVYIVLILFLNPDSPRWIYHWPPLLALYRFLKPLLYL